MEDRKNVLLIEPGNVEELIDGIIKLAYYKDLRARSGNRAREDLLENFTGKKNVDRLEKR